MKKPGDPQRTSAPSFDAMIAEMAETLSSAGDARFQRFWNFRPIPVCQTWLARTKRTNVLVGSNKSGKTTTGVWKAICIYTGLVAPEIRSMWPASDKIPTTRPRRVRIIVQDYTKHWPETIRPLLLDDDKWGMLPKAWAQNYNPDEHIFYGPDGSFLSIMAINPKEQDENKIATILRGPLIDHTYIDELQKRAVYTESLTRNATLRDGPRSVDLGFCPQEGFDWTWEDLYKLGYNPQTDEERPEDQHHPDVNIMRVSMKDNPAISQENIAEYIRTLKPWEVAYRVDGKYSARAGDPYFSIPTVLEWQKAGVIRPGDQYIITDKEVKPEDGVFDGELKKVTMPTNDDDHNVWEVWETPRDAEYYLMTVDTAEGHKDSDFAVGDIWRCSKEKRIDVNHPVQCAQFRKRRIKPGDFIEECLCMATIYGEIMVAYEVNNTSGGTVRDRSRNYVNLYKRIVGKKEVEDETEFLGWYTDTYNKPAALEEAYHLTIAWTPETCGIRSKATADEMVAYQEKIERDAKTGLARRVFQPVQGMHDDTITTLYVMAYILRLQNEVLTLSDLSGTRPISDEDKESLLEAKAHAKAKRVAPTLRKQPSINLLSRLYGRFGKQAQDPKRQ